MEKIEVNGKIYHKVDYDNNWTLKQQKTAMKLFGNLLYETASGLENSEDQTKAVFDIIFNHDLEVPVLALIFLDDGEEYFNPGTYKQRIEVFADMKYSEEVLTEVVNFLNGRGRSLMADALIYLQAMAPNLKQSVQNV